MQTLPRIMVVDQSLVSRKILEAIAHHLGYQATLYTNSLAAIREFQQRVAPPSLLILDLDLAPPGGYETIKLVRNRLPRLPILVITAQGKLARIKARLAGANSCLDKPIVETDVQAKISELLAATAYR